jgi:phosphoribosylanthranilate isomerase
MKVKICGITNRKSLHAALDYNSDAIGFVFAPSKREITVEKAKQLSLLIPKNITKIGVFVNETKETIETIFAEVDLDYVQLHGDETPAFCKALSVPTIKAFSVVDRNDIEVAASYQVSYYLFDGAKGKYHGGNGETFNWNLLKETTIAKENIILAGGLTARNVAKAIDIVKPGMVDVSSGVETNGEKDRSKVERFIIEARKGDEVNE